MTGGINDRITREDKLDSRCLIWRQELLCCTQVSWLYRDFFCCIRRSFTASAQSGTARRIEIRFRVWEEEEEEGGGESAECEEETLKESFVDLEGKGVKLKVWIVLGGGEEEEEGEAKFVGR